MQPPTSNKRWLTTSHNMSALNLPTCTRHSCALTSHINLRVTFWVVCGLDYPFRKRDSEAVNFTRSSEHAAVVQWIRRLTENQRLTARVGSNPDFARWSFRFGHLTFALIILYTSFNRSKQPQRQSGYNDHTATTASILSSID